MFIEHFKNSFPKLMSMKNKEEIENLEKRLKEVEKLCNKRKRAIKKSLEPPKPKVQKEKHDDAMVNIDTDSVNGLDDELLNNQEPETAAPQRQSIASKQDLEVKKSVKNIPAKSKGGDPHGAFAKYEEEQLAKFKKSQDANDNINVSARLLFRNAIFLITYL